MIDRIRGKLDDIDLRERAGVLTEEQAQAERIGVLNRALKGEYGGLSSRDALALMGGLREATRAQADAQRAATDALSEQTQALRDLKASIDEQLSYADAMTSLDTRDALRAMADLISRQAGERARRKKRLDALEALQEKYEVMVAKTQTRLDRYRERLADVTAEIRQTKGE